MSEDLDLTIEFKRAQVATGWPEFNWLLMQGVPTKTLLNGPRSFRIGVAKVHGADGRWNPHDAGHRAFIMPANETDGFIDDLVAWRPGTPSIFWRRRGAAPLMGREAIFRAIEEREPLHLCSTPLDWLRCGRRGFVMLDWNAPLPMHIDEVSEFQVDDVALARRLQKLLERPRAIPPIKVKRAALAKTVFEAHQRREVAA